MCSSSIIAVHGLGAHPDHAWSMPSAEDESKKVDWLKDEDMLPSFVPNARILRYGYYAKWFGEDSVKSRIQDMAMELLYTLKVDSERTVRCFVPL